MIEQGQVINILPPILDGNVTSDKRRYMIISDKEDDTIYRTENFPEIENYISFAGEKVRANDLKNIMNRRKDYINRTGKIKIITFTKKEILDKNKVEVMNQINILSIFGIRFFLQ